MSVSVRVKFQQKKKKKRQRQSCWGFYTKFHLKRPGLDESGFLLQKRHGKWTLLEQV